MRRVETVAHRTIHCTYLFCFCFLDFAVLFRSFKDKRTSFAMKMSNRRVQNISSTILFNFEVYLFSAELFSYLLFIWLSFRAWTWYVNVLLFSVWELSIELQINRTHNILNKWHIIIWSLSLSLWREHWLTCCFTTI